MVKLRGWLRTVFLMAIMIMGLSWVPFGVVWAGLNDGLVAYYPFDGNANDESGNGNHGIVHGAMLATDRFGKESSAYKFDGVDDIIRINDDSNMLAPKTLTISVWLMKTGSSSDSVERMILYKGNYDPLPNMAYSIEIEPQMMGRIRLRSDTANYPNYQKIYTPIIELNKWYHVVGIFDDTRKTEKFYMNGALIGQHIYSGTISQKQEPLCIGGYCYNGEYPFNGLVDDIRIYNRAISESEIQQLYQPCQPSIDIVLNSNNRVTGDKVVINAHIKGAGSSDSSCEQTNVEQKVWVKLPNDTVIPLIDPFTVLTLLPFDSIETKIFEYVFSGAEPIGSYQIGGRLLHPFSGDAISTDIEVLTFSQ
jgi:hypothetical protein